jgi:hypothetical protein
MNVKLDTDLVRKAKVVAAVKNITLSKYITELVRSRVEKDLVVAAVDLASPAVTDDSAFASSLYPRIG